MPTLNNLTNDQLFAMMKSLLLTQSQVLTSNQNNVAFNAQSESRTVLKDNQVFLKLKNLITSKKMKENHLDNNILHLEKHTTPPSLFFNRMY